MDKKILQALKGSIAKWEAIVAGTGEDKFADNCALCQEYEGCEGCPVAGKTGLDQCFGSPWEAWSDTFGHNETRFANTPERKQLAQAELDFLRSLLPEKTP